MTAPDRTVPLTVPLAVHLTADVVAVTMSPEAGLSVLLVTRGAPPYRGRLALPGGFVEPREDAAQAARRELREETGVRSRGLPLREVGAYTAPRRDPRHRTVTVAYLTALPPDTVPRAGDDAAAAWHPVAALRGTRRLAFDHAGILGDALALLGRELETSPMAADLLAGEFTLAELRRVYEEVWETTLDPGNFQRKVASTPGLVAETGRHSVGGRGRPAALYRRGPADVLSPRFLRPEPAAADPGEGPA